MAISQESRNEFAQTVEPIKKKISESLEKEKGMTLLMRTDNAGIEYKKIILSEEMIYVASLYMSINNVSLEILETKNNDALNDARKSIYKAIIYLEDIVSNIVDCPYSELTPKLENIVNTPIEKRFYLIRKLGLAIQLLVDAFGDNSKWKASFVELRGRFAVVAKNFIDMQKALKDYYDPRSPDYDNTVLYMRLICKLLDKSAMEYRDRYETATRRIDDMSLAIKLLNARRRIALLLHDSNGAEEIKKKAVVWKSKMEADAKSGASK